ncbi:phosphotransferase [Streptomyces sp. 3MP-14]|uniref:Phosphotransferase n=1 Tax=Streptomyces mimosae TaxID=2586635 RepID=A0A5N6A3E3_9ACTN|nr:MULTISPECIES: aminoglycoside phosphotransferase family protein [Streptomyces]KAB8163307.1 phosphotransferase [Streptomyces mimosae]KAB8174584.1 phosphotransferase [Streptomyces sp. 3MP-14]
MKREEGEEPWGIARRHGVADDEVRPAPLQGVAARVWLLGEELVLKVARPDAAFAADLRKERRVIPFAVKRGLRTPELLDAGELDGQDGPVPWLLSRRAPGGPAAGGEPGDRALRELGHQLAALHSAAVPAEVRAALPVDGSGDPRPGIDGLARRGHLSPALAGWLGDWLGRLAEERPDDPGATLIHGDIAAGNLLLAENGELTALLDWGDAAWADPAIEFAKVPPRLLPPVLTGYLGDPATLAAAGPGWVARVLWHQLSWAVFRLSSPPDPVAGHWSAQPANRLLELLRGYVEELPAPWAGWMRSQRLP